MFSKSFVLSRKFTFITALFILILAAMLIVAYLPVARHADAAVGDVILCSSTDAGVEGDANSISNENRSIISADGRYVVFSSQASNLVPGTTPGRIHIFRKDLTTNEVVLVSADAGGVEGDSNSNTPTINSNGNLVVFESTAGNFVAGTTPGRLHIYLKDISTGDVILVSADALGNEGNGNSEYPSISGDGSLVCFDSFADNLVLGTTAGRKHVYLKNIPTGAVLLMSSNGVGVEGDANSWEPVISTNGGFVVFTSQATNLVPPTVTAQINIFRKNVQTGETVLASANASGTEGDAASRDSFISSGGRYVVFRSFATNLVPPLVTTIENIFRKDVETGEVLLVSANAAGAEGDAGSDDACISADGFFVTFDSTATNLGPATTVGRSNVFMKNLLNNEVILVSENAANVEGDDNSVTSCITRDGRYVAFVSTATNLVTPATTAARSNVYRKELEKMATRWFLAEGSTGTNEFGTFETWVLIQNPGADPANVQLTYQTPAGATLGPALTLDPQSRQTVEVAATVPNEFSVSTAVTSDNPVIAERAMYWNSVDGVYRQAAHDSIGVTIPATTWHLAEGSTGTSELGDFETWVLVQNPGDEPANVQLTFQTPAGPVPGPALTLAPQSRQTVNVFDTVPNEFSVSTTVTSADNPVIAERAMYWNSGGGVYRQAAHDSIGVTMPAQKWYLAEGSTGTNEFGSFETWVLVQNPGVDPANVQFTYQTPTGQVPGPALTLDPQSRQTVNVANSVPAEFNVSTTVTSDNPIIAERAMYWNANTAFRQAAHDSIGTAVSGQTWYLAEGSTGTNEFGSFETWVLVQNPGADPANIQIFYQTPSGEAPGPTLTLAPNTRQSINVADIVANEFSVSTRITSDMPIIAERAMYWNSATGIFRQAAHDSIGFDP